MKTKKVFWGVSLITAGLIFLLHNFNMVSRDLFQVFNYWPLLLILWGISLFKLPDFIKYTVTALSAILFAFITMAFLLNPFGCRDWNWHIGDWDNDDYSNTSYQNEKNASFTFDKDSNTVSYGFFVLNGGGSSITVTGTTDKIFEAQLTSSKYDTNCFQSGDSAFVKLNIGKKRGNNFNFVKGMQADLQLNNNMLWDFEVNSGAAELDLDLSDFKIGDLKIKSGVSDADITIGDKNYTVRIDLSIGVSNIVINLPATFDCQIDANQALSSSDFEGFKSAGNNKYVNDDFSNKKKIIYIHSKGALSNIEVNRI